MGCGRGAAVWWVMGVAALLGLAALGAAASAANLGDTHAADSKKQLQRGAYLVRLGDCAACHTRAGGQPFAGGRMIPTPFGGIHAPNITPDEKTGIGAWSAADFRAAMHQGVAKDGRLLYPAFPFTSYTQISDADVDAMYAWLRTRAPVRQPNTPSTLHFPWNLRKLLLAWRALYFTAGRYQDDPAKSTEWNRGAYLVRGLGHCAECHAPRNVLGAIKVDPQLAGALIPKQNWYAPDLGTQAGGGLHGWNRRDIVDLLTTGRSAHGSAFGPMGEVVQQSLQYLLPADANAMATYLLDQPGEADAVAQKRKPTRMPRQDAVLAAGQQIYLDHCAACHGRQGRGVAHVYPALAGNSSLLADNPVNAIRAVLLGGFGTTTKAYPRPYSMPPFMQTLDDPQVAAVVTWLRQSWGNHASAVTPRAVRKLRSVPVD